MKTIRFTLLFLAFVCTLAQARENDHAGILGILVVASNDRGTADRRLGEYEPNLKRILRFESYRYLGEDSASLAVPGAGQLNLGDGQRLEIATESSEGRSLRVRVRWLAGGRSLMNTSLVLRSGVPAILGGPAVGRKGDVYAIILIGRD